ncbi:MAG: hypothetical protein GC155_05140 [Alphaproteobacteria bacterium]|nr:hypothetical protein [Alphaproteobacteria bacterium]
MKWIVFALLLLLVGGSIAAAMLPMSAVAGAVQKRLPWIQYESASGTVWNGKLSGVVVNGQDLGDVSIKVDAGQIFTGNAAGHAAFASKGLSGEAGVSYSLIGGKTTLAGILVQGDASTVPILPARLRGTDGKFRLSVSQIVLQKGACSAASGEVWTDALAKADLGHGWVGPELRGPVTCEGGKVAVEASGKSASGEDVSASLRVGLNLSLDLQARVANATQGAVETLTELGFQPLDGAYVLHQQLGDRPVSVTENAHRDATRRQLEAAYHRA